MINLVKRALRGLVMSHGMVGVIPLMRVKLVETGRGSSGMAGIDEVIATSGLFMVQGPKMLIAHSLFKL